MPDTQHEFVSSSRVLTPVRFERFSAHTGAIVHGVDLGQSLSAELRETLRNGLFEYGVLFFRHQKLSPEQFLAATRTFGEPLRHNPYLPSLEEFSGVEIIESGIGRRLANESWHADVTWQHNPPFATALHATELPPFGGDTVWTLDRRIRLARPAASRISGDAHGDELRRCERLLACAGRG